MALGYLRLPACALRRRCSSLAIPHTAVFDARSFSTSAALTSGHSRWSKIKHDKAVVDSRRGSAFSKVSNEISAAAKEAGGEMSNLRLQAALLAARKAKMPKEKIQIAIDRGNGVTASGARLESLAIEAIGPGNVAMVVECLAEHRLRCLQEVKAILTKFGAQPTPTVYLFTRKGVIRLARGDLDPENVLEIALEIEGTDDVEDVEEGESEGPEIVVTTDLSALGNVVQGLKAALKDVQVLSSSIEYIPNEDTMVEVPEKKRDDLDNVITRLQEYQDVTNVATNML